MTLTRVSGTVETVATDASGHIPAGTRIWLFAVPGKYDIIVDVDGSGTYSVGDALDDNQIQVTAGFFVVPELPLGTATALMLMLAALALFKKRPTVRIKL